MIHLRLPPTLQKNPARDLTKSPHCASKTTYKQISYRRETELQGGAKGQPMLFILGSLESM